MTVLGTVHVERKEAGRTLMKEILTLVQLQQEGQIDLAGIGGFDVVFDGERVGNGGFHYQIVLQRTGADYEVDLAMTVTPLGAISRLEHALDGFETEQMRHRNRLADARRRLASYKTRDGGTFAFADELKEKRVQLREVDDDLAETARQDASASAA